MPTEQPSRALRTSADDRFPAISGDLPACGASDVTAPRFKFTPRRAGLDLLAKPRDVHGLRPLASPRTGADSLHQERMHKVRLAPRTLHRSKRL